MAKFKEKRMARRMRWQGKSVGEIALKLNVSKGSVSKWCGDIFLTEIQKERLDKRQQKNSIDGENNSKREQKTREDL